MRIAHLITGLAEGGAEMTLWRLLARMDRNRFESEVICLSEDGPVGERLRTIGVPVSVLGMRPGRPSVSGMYRLMSALRRIRPQVLQTWLYHADIAGLTAGRACGVPAIVWNIRCADMILTRYSRLSALTVRACARWSDRPTAVVVNSQAGQRHHEGIGYRPKRWVQIPNGVDSSVFRPDAAARRAIREELAVPPDTLLVGLIGRFDPMKNHRGFLDAAAALAGRHGKLRFVLAGTRVDRNNVELVAQVGRLGLDGRVHMLGSRPDVARVTAALDLLVSSSHSEGFPNVLIEAMACAVPCVATDAGDSRLIVEDTGLIVPPNDPVGLADAIDRLLVMGPDVRAQLGRAARARVLASYDLGAAVARYERLYASLPEDERCAA